MMKLTQGEISQATSLIDDLFWDWDRLSSDGQETLNCLAKVFKMEGYYDNRK